MNTTAIKQNIIHEIKFYKTIDKKVQDEEEMLTFCSHFLSSLLYCHKKDQAVTVQHLCQNNTIKSFMFQLT